MVMTDSKLPSEGAPPPAPGLLRATSRPCTYAAAHSSSTRPENRRVHRVREAVAVAQPASLNASLFGANRPISTHGGFTAEKAAAALI